MFVVAARVVPTSLPARAGPPLAYLVLAGWLFSPFLHHPTGAVPGGADGMIYAWFIENAEQSLVHLRNPLVSDFLNAPHGVNVMWNTSLLLPALALSPLTALLGSGPVVILLAAVSPALSASLAYLALLRLAGRAWIAAPLGAIYGFGPFFVGQYGHVHLTLAFLPPLLVLTGVDLGRAPWWPAQRRGIALGLLLVAALLCGEEVLAMTVVATVVFGTACWIFLRSELRAVRERLLVTVAWALPVAAVLGAGPLAVQLFGPSAITSSFRPDGSVDALGFVVPGGLQHFAPAAAVAASGSYSPVLPEGTLYLGIPLALVVLGIGIDYVRRRDKLGLALLTTGFASAAISVGQTVRVGGFGVGPGPWAAVSRIPLLGGIIAVRFSLLTSLLAALVICWWFRNASGRRQWLALAVVLFGLMALCPAGRYHPHRAPAVPHFFTSSAVRVIPAGAVVVLLPDGPDPNSAAATMRWQLVAGLRFRLVGGYAMFADGGRQSYQAAQPVYLRLLESSGRSGALPDRADVTAARSALAADRVRDVVITDAQRHRDTVEVLARELAGCSIERVADVDLCAVP